MDRHPAFAAVFDLDGFIARQPGREVLPRGPIEPGDDPTAEAALVDDFLQRHLAAVVHEPYGLLDRPYLMPGGPYDQLWDWDAFFTWAGAPRELHAVARNSVQLLLHYVDDDGRSPRLIAHDVAMYSSLPLPLLAQWVLLLDDDPTWLESCWPRLEQVREFYERIGVARHGLYRLPTFKGNGFDNDPVLYGKRDVAAVHVNCLHLRELRAMAHMAKRIDPARAAYYHRRAEQLRQALHDFHYDPVAGMYYHLDLADVDGIERQPRTWELPYRWATASCLWPLWTGVATPAQAARMIKGYVLRDERFLAPAGIRSFDASERLYNNLASGAPSNWQGPVWAQTTCLTCFGLARYGFREQAIAIARRLVGHFAADIRSNGCLHECYHGDSGQPLIHPGFLSWNFLAYRLEARLRAGEDPLRLPDEDRS